jgi:hypothetical protein
LKTVAARDDCRCRAKSSKAFQRWSVCCSQLADSQTVVTEDLEWMQIAAWAG